MHAMILSHSVREMVSAEDEDGNDVLCTPQYYHMSARHLGRYLAEFAGRHNARYTAEHMRSKARDLVGKRPT